MLGRNLTLKVVALLSAFILWQPVAGRAADKETLGLAEAVGGYAGGLLYDVYLGMSDLESALSAGGKDSVAAIQIKRHLGSLNVVSGFDKKLRPLFSGDKTMVAFLDKLMATADELRGEGEALIAFTKSGSPAELKTAKEKKEAARALIIPLMGLPDNRDIVP